MPALLQISTLCTFVVYIGMVYAICDQCQCTDSTVIPTLQVIDCRGKSLTQIPSFPDTGNQVEYYELTLKGNLISTISAGAFSNIKVHVLDILDNELVQISSGAFQGLESTLKELKLGGQGSNLNQISLSFLTNLTKLEVLDMRYLKLTTIDRNTFPQLVNLKNMVLQNMDIEFILTDAFDLKFPAITKLEITGNTKYGLIPVGALRNLTSLQSLALRQNDISNIFFDSFATLSNLLELDLSHNMIDNIANGSFNGIYDNLEFLSLFLCDVDETKLGEIYTKNWPRLTQLNLGNNLITSIPNNFFQKMPSLTSVDLLHNRLTTITSSYFTNLPNINYIDLAENPIVSIQDGAFAQVSTLTQLRLDDLNRANPSMKLVFTTGTIQGLENSLENLNFRDTNLSEDGAWEAIAKLTKLRILDLQSTGLTYIPDLVFKDLKAMEYLDLSINQIHNVTQESFHGLQDSLVTLNVQSNSIVSVDECVLKEFTSLALLYLNNNPIHCDCQMKWFKDLKNNPPPSGFIPNVQCASPQNLDGQPLHQISDQDLGCDTYVPPTCKDLGVTTTEAPVTTPTPPPTLPAPILSMSVVFYNDSAITISWNTNDLTLVQSFIITVSDSTTDNLELLEKEATSYEITGLKSSTMYKVCILALLTESRPPVKECLDVRTLPVFSLGTISTINTVKLSWSISDVTVVNMYTVTYFKFGTTDQPEEVPVDRTKTEFTIEGLDADSRYELCLKITFTVFSPITKCTAADTKPDQGTGATTDGQISTEDNNAGVIAGAVVGGVLAVLIIIAILYILLIRKGKPKQPPPPIQPTSFSAAAFPQTTDHARRFVKSKPQENGQNNIKVISSGKMDPEDSSRISGGSYQFLNEGSVNLQPVPANKMSGANGTSKDYIPPEKRKYTNVGYRNSPNPPSKYDHSYINDPRSQRGQGSVYSNDVEKRPLPNAPKRDEFGFTNKGFKPETPATSPTSPSPNVYHEIPI